MASGKFAPWKRKWYLDLSWLLKWFWGLLNGWDKGDSSPKKERKLP